MDSHARVIVWNGGICTSVVVADKVITARDLEAFAKATAESRMGIVGASINDTNLNALDKYAKRSVVSEK